MGACFVPLFIAFVAVMIVYSIFASHKRRKELADWARARGLAFNPAKDRRFDDRYPEFKCLRRGHSRYAYNCAIGDYRGRRIRAFDYHYATGSGKNRSDHYFSGVLIEPRLPLKPLVVRNEGVFDKLKGAFGFDDIDFESAEFSRQFYVSSPDRRWAYDVLHARVMEYLLSAPRYPFQFDHNLVMVWHSKRMSPVEFEQAIALVEGVLDQLPDYVKQQQGISL